jgi:hypothetical protein
VLANHREISYLNENKDFAEERYVEKDAPKGTTGTGPQPTG